MKKPFLFVGLDYEDPYEVCRFAQELHQVPSDRFGFKINLDAVVWRAFGEGFVPYTQDINRVLAMKRPIFVDLKMWNGKRTMISVAKTLADAGVSYFNVYALAGEDFLKGVVDAVKGTDTRVLGLTVLTHYTDGYCQKMFGCSMREAARRFVDISYNAGCHGIILPGTMLGEVRDLQMEKLVPAVRPEWYGKTGDNLQEQEVYVREAITGGADLLVCSSPIRKSDDRKVALMRTLEEMD